MDLLKNLAKLETESEGLTERVKRAKIVRNDAGELCAPSDLYDSSSQQLWELLPLVLFPLAPFAMTAVYCYHYVLLVCTTISGDGILLAAKAIEKDYLLMNRVAVPQEAPRAKKKPAGGECEGGRAISGRSKRRRQQKEKKRRVWMCIAASADGGPEAINCCATLS